MSGATGAGEIFARIVYSLEKEDTLPALVKGTKLSKSFLEIMNPLDGASYRRSPTRSDTLQKIALRFHTNIPYDSASWLHDGVKREETSMSIQAGKHTIEIILEKNGQEIERKKNSYTVTED